VRDAFPTTSAAFYYSLLQYTTAGSGLSLPDRWRLLGGMIAIAGVLAFEWSTAVLLVLAQRSLHEQLKRMSIDAPVRSGPLFPVEGPLCGRIHDLRPAPRESRHAGKGKIGHNWTFGIGTRFRAWHGRLSGSADCASTSR